MLLAGILGSSAALGMTGGRALGMTWVAWLGVTCGVCAWNDMGALKIANKCHPLHLPVTLSAHLSR